MLFKRSCTKFLLFINLLPKLLFAELNSSYTPSGQPTSLPTTSKSPSYSAQPTLSPTNFTTVSPSRPSNNPTENPTGLPTGNPTQIQSKFQTITNGGFEYDKEKVERKGGIWNKKPGGWSTSRGAVMISYELKNEYYQANSGEIFLSIAAGRRGFITQNISSCINDIMTLTFTASGMDCSDCGLLAFNVTVADHTILRVSDPPQHWHRYNVTFTAPSSYFPLRFQLQSGVDRQLLLDNVAFEGVESTLCVPTSIPTHFPSLTPTVAPTESPTLDPTLEPTTYVPSIMPSPFPTSLDKMLTIQGQANLEYLSYAPELSSIDHAILQTSFQNEVNEATKHQQINTEVIVLSSSRISNRRIILFFEVVLVQGTASAPTGSTHYIEIFNETKEYLYKTTENGELVEHLIKIIDFYKSINSSTSLDPSAASRVSIISYAIGDRYTGGTVTEKFFKIQIFEAVVLSILGGIVFSGLVFIVWRAGQIARAKKTNANDDTSANRLLSDFEMNTNSSHSKSPSIFRSMIPVVVATSTHNFRDSSTTHSRVASKPLVGASSTHSLLNSSDGGGSSSISAHDNVMKFADVTSSILNSPIDSSIHSLSKPTM